MTTKDDDKQNVLDYSSVVEEQKREREREAERRKALDDYNESTFGEKYPFFLGPFLRLAAFAVVIALVLFLLPKGIGRLLAEIAAVAFIILERVRYR